MKTLFALAPYVLLLVSTALAQPGKKIKTPPLNSVQSAIRKANANIHANSNSVYRPSSQNNSKKIKTEKTTTTPADPKEQKKNVRKNKKSN